MNKEVQDELRSIYALHGELKPEVVVDAARSPDSPLHGCFEWNDTKAAEEHRKSQARRLIRIAVYVEPSVSNGPVREYISISEEHKQRSYRSTPDVLTDKRLYEIAKRDALLELAKLEKRYRHIVELRPIWTAVTDMANEALANTHARAN